MTTHLHTHGLLMPQSLDGLNEQHHAALSDTNDKLTRVLDALAPHAAKIQASVELTARGKQERLRALAEQAERERAAVVSQKQAAVGSWLAEADRSIEDALAPSRPELVAETRDDVRLFVSARGATAQPGALLRNSEGHVLPGQGGVADALLQAVRAGNLEGGKLTLAAVRHASPLLRELVGGPDVVTEMTRLLAARVAGAATERKASLEVLHSAIERNGAQVKSRILRLTEQSVLRGEDPIRIAAGV